MPIQKIEYQVLLSSPSDLSEERRLIAEVVSEVSNIWGGQVGASVRLLQWEDLAPGFSSEPQAVINKGLGDRWDIYIGLMHSRFGTATSGYGSGTEEEFLRAYSLWQSNPQDRRLMFYFKNAAVDFDSIDTVQIEKVREFRSKLSKLGGLYKEFSDGPALRDVFRAHLTSILSELHRPSSHLGSSITGSGPSPHVEIVAEDPEDPGFLDLLESSLLGMASLSKATTEVGEALGRGNEAMVAASERVKTAVEAGDFIAARKGVSFISNQLTHMAKEIRDKRRDFSNASRPAFENLSKAISIAKAASVDQEVDVSQFVKTIENTSDVIQGFITAIAGAERSLDSIPNVAQELSRARVALKSELASLRVEVNTSLMLMRDLRSIVVDT